MDSLVRALKALADPIRLRIVEFLRHPQRSCCAREGVVCACDLEEYLGLTQPTISHHMKILVDAGLVQAAKHGRWVYYDLNRQAFASVVGALGHYQTGQLATRQADSATHQDHGGL
ncbi:MAG: ArsR family transcriptional regulator [Acidobacteria bacterium]|nr:MAG: ArsR family transcriptional regulator [Acidobacteriota bacterium]